MSDKETIKKKRPRPVEPETIEFHAPDGFRSEYCAMLRDHIGKGFSFSSFEIGVTNATLQRWLRDYPEFREARESGERKKLKILEAAGMRMAVVESNVSAWKLMMSQHGVGEKTASVQHHIHERIDTNRDEPVRVEETSQRKARKARIRELAAELEINLSGDTLEIEGEVIDES